MSDLANALRKRDDWRANPRATPWLGTISQVEKGYGLPADLLGRMAHRESSFRPNATSPAGAVGLMQIIPKHHPKAKPQDPTESMNYAAQYLTELKGRFGDWEKALAAYNYGPRNVRNLEAKYGENWLANAPQETKDYVFQLLGIE